MNAAPTSTHGPQRADVLIPGKGSLERSANLTFVVAFLALLAVSLLSVRSLLEVRADADLRSQTHEIINQTKQVLYAAIDLQNRLRGYVITQDEKLLDAYTAARETVKKDVLKLREITADHPNLQRHVTDLETLIKQRIVYAEQLVDIRRKQGFETAKKFVTAGYGQRTTDQIRVVLRDMNTEGQQLLSERTQQIKDSAQYTLLVILGLGGLAIAILGWNTMHIRHNIAKRRQAEHERDRLFNYALDIYCIADFEGYFKQVNPTWTRLLGWTEEEMQATPYLEFIHPDDREATTHAAGTLRDGKQVFLFDNRYRGKDGSYKWISWVAYPLMEEKLVFAVGRDVTEKKLAEKKLDEVMELQRAILANAAHSIISTTPDGIITTFNQTAERMLGYSANEVVGLQSPAILHDESEVAARAQEFSNELGVVVKLGFEVFVIKARLGLPNEYEWTYIRKDGTRLAVLLSVTALRDAQGSITGFLGIAVDISLRKQSEAQLQLAMQELRRREEIILQQAMHDELTGLPNRRLFYDRLAMALSKARRHSQKVAVAFIDLDYFKEINDTLGHEAGDKFLVAIAQLIKAVPREEDTCARLGGDEFALILSNVVEKDQVGLVMQRILGSLNREIIIDGNNLHASASIGVAVFPEDAEDVPTVLRHADIAMYCSKEAGRNTYRFWDEQMASSQHANQVAELSDRP